jgi:hypothetical protein
MRNGEHTIRRRHQRIEERVVFGYGLAISACGLWMTTMAMHDAVTGPPDMSIPESSDIVAVYPQPETFLLGMGELATGLIPMTIAARLRHNRIEDKLSLERQAIVNQQLSPQTAP